MAFFPFMIEVEGHKALVVGAGQSAKDKIRTLTDFGADVTVVAPVISAEVVKQGKNIRIERRVYRPGECRGYEIVVAATDNPAVNKQIAHDAARFGAICSVNDDSSRSGFIFPQVIKRNKYSVAICADSTDDALAVKIKEKIEKSVPEKADEIAALFRKAKNELDHENEEKTRLADISGAVEGSVSGPDESETTESDQASEENHDDISATSEEGASSASGSDEVTRVYEEGSVLKVGTLSDRLSQVRADAVIAHLEAKGISCSKVLLRYRGSQTGQPADGEGQEDTTFLGADDALENGVIDIAVRRAEDVTHVLPEKLTIAACLPREDARNMLVTRQGTGNNEIEAIETDDISRKVQIEKFLRTGEARVTSEGIQAVINRLKAGETDAAVLAAADLKKLLFTEDKELDCEYIDIDKSLPPAGQGITVLETRDSGKAFEAAAELSDYDTMILFRSEWYFRRSFSASDDIVAALSILNGGQLLMKVMKYNGSDCVYFAGIDKPENGEALAGKLTEKIKKAL